MYKKGRLKTLIDPEKCPDEDEIGFCAYTNHMHNVHDYDKEKGPIWYQYPDICAYLPHSCDEWIIGGEEEIKSLIADLQEVLKKKEIGNA